MDVFKGNMFLVSAMEGKVVLRIVLVKYHHLKSCCQFHFNNRGVVYLSSVILRNFNFQLMGVTLYNHEPYFVVRMVKQTLHFM